MKKIAMVLLSLLVSQVALADKTVTVINNSPFNMIIHYGFSYPTPTAFVSTQSYELKLPRRELDKNYTEITFPKSDGRTHYFLQIFDANDDNPKHAKRGPTPLQPPCRVDGDSENKINGILLESRASGVICKPTKINMDLSRRK